MIRGGTKHPACVLSAAMAAMLLAAASAGAAVIPIEFILAPDGVYDNQVNLTVTYGVASTQPSTASGTFAANLYLDIDPVSYAATATGIGYVMQPAPGNITFTNMSFFGGLMTTTNLRGAMLTANPPDEISGGTFTPYGNALVLNGGELRVGIEVTDLSVAGNELTLNFKDTTPSASLQISAPMVVGQTASYDVVLLMPVGFPAWDLPGMPGAKISADGMVRAVGSIAVPVPEPSSLLLLIGGLIGLAAYVWRKRK